MRGGGVSGRTIGGGFMGLSSGLDSDVCGRSGGPSTGIRAGLGDVCVAGACSPCICPRLGVSLAPNVLCRVCAANAGDAPRPAGEEAPPIPMAFGRRLLGVETSVGNWIKTSLPVGWLRANDRLMLLALLGAMMVLLPRDGVSVCECDDTPAVDGGRGRIVTSHLISPSVSVHATDTSYALPSDPSPPVDVEPDADPCPALCPSWSDPDCPSSVELCSRSSLILSGALFTLGLLLCRNGGGGGPGGGKLNGRSRRCRAMG
jgi:hypothetical protein